MSLLHLHCTLLTGSLLHPLCLWGCFGSICQSSFLPHCALIVPTSSPSYFILEATKPQLSHNNAPTSWNVAMLRFKCFVVSSDWVKRHTSMTRTQHLLAFRDLLWPLPLHFVFSVDTMFPVVSVTLCVFSFFVPHSLSSKNKLEACLYCYFFPNS